MVLAYTAPHWSRVLLSKTLKLTALVILRHYAFNSFTMALNRLSMSCGIMASLFMVHDRVYRERNDVIPGNN